MDPNIQIFLAVFSGIAILLLFILVLKWHAFLSLLVSAIWMGIVAGIPLATITQSITKGMGDTLGFVATIVGLGCLFGYLLEQSGGAQSIAHFLLKRSGPRYARPALMLTGYILAIPVFFDVAFLMIFPLVNSLAQRAGKPLTYFSLPLLVGIALTHSFVPPTPGPVAVANILKADLGLMIGLGLLVTLPTAIVGIWFSKWLIINTETPFVNSSIEQFSTVSNKNHVSVFKSLFVVITPLILMMISSAFSSSFSNGNIWVEIFIFIGHPIIALLLATVLAVMLYKNSNGINIQQLLDKSLLPAGSIILITGAGGVLKQILVETGLGELIASIFQDNPSSLLFMAYGAAAIMRILQGSATIAMITAAGVVSASAQEILLLQPLVAVLAALSIASGSIIASHVNDSGFWLINRLSQQTVKETLKTFTILSTVLSIVSFSVILVLNFMISLI